MIPISEDDIPREMWERHSAVIEDTHTKLPEVLAHILNDADCRRLVVQKCVKALEEHCEIENSIILWYGELPVFIASERLVQILCPEAK